jgi:hypothetical protein
MAQREVIRTTATYIVTRERDEKRHLNPAYRGAYLLLLPGKMPEIVLDGLASPREQREAEQRCQRELEQQIYEAQALGNRDMQIENRRELVRATGTYVLSRSMDPLLHKELENDPARRGGFLELPKDRLPEIILDGLSSQMDQFEAERRCMAQLKARDTVDRLRDLFKTRRSMRPQVARRSFKPNESHIGQRLLSAGLVSESALERALARQEQLGDGRRVGSLMVEDGALTAVQLAKVLGQQRGVQAVSTGLLRVDPPLRQIFPLMALQDMQAAPLFLVGRRLSMAMSDAHDERSVANLQTLTTYEIIPLQACQWQVQKLLQSMGT